MTRIQRPSFCVCSCWCAFQGAVLGDVLTLIFRHQLFPVVHLGSSQHGLSVVRLLLAVLEKVRRPEDAAIESIGANAKSQNQRHRQGACLREVWRIHRFLRIVWTRVSKLFCPRATYTITHLFEGRTSYVMWLFREKLHSTKSQIFS